MANVLIAYNNDSQVGLHDFFDMCADEAKQICANNRIGYSSVCPPNLNEHNVIANMPCHNICVIAGHGDEDGIYNENDDDVVSTHTTNYNFKGKGFYSIACSCAKNLYPNLLKHGLQLFIGYNDTFNVRGDRIPFVISAMAGLNSFLSGDNLETAKQKMLSVYDKQIEYLDQTDPWAAVDLAHDKEALVFEGDDTLVFNDLNKNY